MISLVFCVEVSIRNSAISLVAPVPASMDNRRTKLFSVALVNVLRRGGVGQASFSIAVSKYERSAGMRSIFAQIRSRPINEDTMQLP